MLERIGRRMRGFGGKAQGAPELATPRLRLKPLEDADLEFVEALVQDPAVRRFLGGPVEPRRARAVALGYLGAAPRETVWVVRHKASPVPVGLVFLSNPKRAQETELSYMFKSEVWGAGFATEAVQRVLSHALSTLRRPRVFAMTQAANGASCRLLQRIGMHEEAREMRHGAEQVIFAVRRVA